MSDNPGESPAIQRLPPELLADVFILCCVDNERKKLNLTPWNLSQVCRSWRQAAISHSPLWSSICIIGNAKAGDEAEVYRPPPDMLGCWLDRSSTQPLTLTLLEVSHGFPLPPPSMQYPLLESVSRAEDIYLCSAAANLSHNPSLPVSPSDIPLLREFFMPRPGDSRPGYHSLPIPWSQLRRLTLTHSELELTCDQCRYIFDEAKSLIFFQLSAKFLCREADSTNPSEPKFQSSSIREFKFKASLVDLALLCRHIELPFLEALTLDIESLYYEAEILLPMIWPILETFITAIRPGLKSLTVRSLRITSSQFTQLLKYHSSSLVNLHVSSLPYVYEDVLTAMTVQDTGVNVLCPHLSTLTLDRCLNAEEGALAAMVESRSVVSPLSRVSVAGEMLTEDFGDDFKRLEDLRTSQPSLHLDWDDVDSDDEPVYA